MSISNTSIVSSSISAKGSIFIHNGTSTQLFSVGSDGLVIQAQSSVSSGLRWDTAPVGDSTYYESISSNTLTAAASTVSITSIPTTYKDILLIIQARNTSTGSITTDSVNLDITFNTDTAASNAKYAQYGVKISSSVRTLENLTSQDKIKAYAAICSSGNTVGSYGIFEMKISQYNNTQDKVGNYYGHAWGDQTNGASSLFQTFRYTGTSGITQINLTPSDAFPAFAIGSRIDLYGIK